MTTSAEDPRSIGELLRDLAGDSASLMRQELMLASTRRRKSCISR